VSIIFIRANTRSEREAINLFLVRHNSRGQGSTKGYVAYYAATLPDDGRWWIALSPLRCEVNNGT
jgi:hypothetical protein